MFYGYTAYQAERPMARAEQRQADAQLGKLCAALAHWRQSLASPVRAIHWTGAVGAREDLRRACQP
jgi:hypothetical protein